MNWRQVLLAVFLSQSTVTAISPDHLLVKTDSGWVRGTEEISATGKTVHAFLGIPYAQPPLGRLRFRHPEPVSPWQGVFNGTSLPHSCMQRLLRISFHIPYLRKQVSITPLSEDCLKLNVWVPSGAASDKLPVVVFLHGGGYSFGSSATTVNLGDSLAAEENLIVVTLNYRLASLGFLFLDHPEAPGNYGLYDQRLAMEWIHRNAEAFGGDPSRITLFGQSAGSSSALFHLLSGKSDHLIQRLVLCSPPRVSYVLPDRETSVRKAVELAQNVGCVSNGSDPEAIVRCLRNVDASELISSEPGKDYNNVIYFPIVDGDIVPVDWQRRFSEGRVKGVDILLGSNKNEGTLFLMLFSPHIFQISRDTVSPTFEDYKELLRNIDLKSEPVLKTIEFHYTSWINLEDTSKMFEYSEKTINDVLVGCPTTK